MINLLKIGVIVVLCLLQTTVKAQHQTNADSIKLVLDIEHLELAIKTAKDSISSLRKRAEVEKKALNEYKKKNKKAIKEAQETKEDLADIEKKRKEISEELSKQKLLETTIKKEEEKQANYKKLEQDSIDLKSNIAKKKSETSKINTAIKEAKTSFEQEKDKFIEQSKKAQSLNIAVQFPKSIETTEQKIEQYLLSSPYNQSTNKNLLSEIDNKNKYYWTLKDYCETTITAFKIMDDILYFNDDVKIMAEIIELDYRQTINGYQIKYPYLYNQFYNLEQQIKANITGQSNPLQKPNCY